MRTWPVWIVSVLIVSGCTVGPEYTKPAVDVPEEWRYQYTETGAESIVNKLWWEQFNDPELDWLVHKALLYNLDVRQAAARVEEFAARVDIARSGYYPQIGYGAQGGRRETSGEGQLGGQNTFNEYSVGVNVGWELDVWGKIARATEAARANLLAEEESRRTIILTLVSSVATSYVRLRALDRQLVIARRTTESRRETVELFQLKFDGGLISELEVAQVKSEYQQALVSIPTFERQITLAENSLSILIGENPRAIKRGSDIDQLRPPNVPQGVPSELLERRPDIRLAEQDLVAANAQIGVAKAQYYPSISLTGLLGFASSALSDLFSSNARQWALAADATGPIFSGGQLSGQVRVSEAIQKQALAAYLFTVQNAFREVDDSLTSVQKYREELIAQKGRVDSLQQYADFAQLRYDEGQVSYLEVLDATRRLFDAKLAYTDNQSNVYASLIGVYKAMGGGWVISAEEVANETDYVDDTDEDEEFRLIEQTQPSALTPAAP